MMLGKNVSTGKPIEVPVAADGLTVPVSGTLTATIDESTLATSAKQDTGNTSLGTIATNIPAKGTAVMAGSTPVTLATNDTLTVAANASLATVAASAAGSKPAGAATSANSVPVVIATDDAQAKALRQPKQAIAVTPSDSFDVTATATKGLWVSVAGIVNVTYVGDSTAVGLGTLPAGTFIPGELKRVNAATTATVISFYG